MEAVKSIKNFILTLYIILKMFILSLMGYDVTNNRRQRRFKDMDTMKSNNNAINACGPGG